MSGRSIAAVALGLLWIVTGIAHADPPATAPSGQVGPGVPPFWVRSGYKVTLAAEGIGEVRFIEFDDAGNLYVAQPGRGNIIKLSDPDDAGKFRKHTTFIKDHKRCHGMVWKDGWLWFTTTGAIYKARDTKNAGVADEIVEVIPDGDLPHDGGHWWRSLCLTDHYLFTSIGDDGNDNDHTHDERCKVWRFTLDGKDKTLWCTGIRNTEKLRVRPGTDELWGCDHGSDNYGGQLGESKGMQPVTDLNPPCEFNRYIQGGFYGHPFVVGNKLPRLEFRDRPDIIELANQTIPPEWCLGPHWAPNGWNFTQSDTLGFAGDALIALHGSWNSTVKVGYRVERVCFDKETGKPYGSLKIVGTLGADGVAVLDRPVDIAEAKDGTVLFSCDFGRKIYRISKAP